MSNHPNQISINVFPQAQSQAQVPAQVSGQQQIHPHPQYQQQYQQQYSQAYGSANMPYQQQQNPAENTFIHMQHQAAHITTDPNAHLHQNMNMSMQHQMPGDYSHTHDVTGRGIGAADHTAYHNTQAYIAGGHLQSQVPMYGTTTEQTSTHMTMNASGDYTNAGAVSTTPDSLAANTLRKSQDQGQTTAYGMSRDQQQSQHNFANTATDYNFQNQYQQDQTQVQGQSQPQVATNQAYTGMDGNTVNNPNIYPDSSIPLSTTSASTTSNVSASSSTAATQDMEDKAVLSPNSYIAFSYQSRYLSSHGTVLHNNLSQNFMTTNHDLFFTSIMNQLHTGNSLKKSLYATQLNESTRNSYIEQKKPFMIPGRGLGSMELQILYGRMNKVVPVRTHPTYHPLNIQNYQQSVHVTFSRSISQHLELKKKTHCSVGITEQTKKILQHALTAYITDLIEDTVKVSQRRANIAKWECSPDEYEAVSHPGQLVREIARLETTRNRQLHEKWEKEGKELENNSYILKEAIRKQLQKHKKGGNVDGSIDSGNLSNPNPNGYIKALLPVDDVSGEYISDENLDGRGTSSMDQNTVSITTSINAELAMETEKSEIESARDKTSAIMLALSKYTNNNDGDDTLDRDDGLKTSLWNRIGSQNKVFRPNPSTYPVKISPALVASVTKVTRKSTLKNLPLGTIGSKKTVTGFGSSSSAVTGADAGSNVTSANLGIGVGVGSSSILKSGSITDSNSDSIVTRGSKPIVKVTGADIEHILTQAQSTKVGGGSILNRKKYALHSDVLHQLRMKKIQTTLQGKMNRKI